MVIAILITLWLAVFIGIVVIFLSTPKGRRMFKLLWKSTKVRIAIAIPPLFIAAIAIAFRIIPATTEPTLDGDRLFMDYSRKLAGVMRDQGAIVIDSTCSLDSAKPELAYILPELVSAYHEEVKKPTTARLVQLDDTLRLSFDGYKQFKNRTILIIKGAKKRLGPRYTLNMESHGENHELMVTYKGKPWNNEQLCALPVTEAAVREKIDPAVLMSLIRHISNFEFNYKNDNQRRGLLALDSGTGIDQVYIAAHKLKQAQDSGLDIEDVVAMFYPDNNPRNTSSEWRKNPLKNSWVREVLADVQYYRNNGLK